MATGKRNTASFLFTVNNDKFFINLNDDNYSDLASTLGMTKISSTNADQLEGAQKLTATGAVAAGKVVPIKIKYEAVGKKTKTGKQVFATAKIYVPIGKLEESLGAAGLVTKKYRKGSVVEARGILQRLITV